MDTRIENLHRVQAENGLQDKENYNNANVSLVLGDFVIPYLQCNRAYTQE